MTQGWVLPGFDVHELIGYGATGEVWRAVDLASGEVVALKRLRPDADPAAVDALHREVAVLRTLDTPYVVRLRDVVRAGADTVLVLDHAAGGSLAALLARRGRLEPGEVVTIAGPLAAALAAAHALGLVHGDVTPANVLFTADGMPLLSDLGLARVAGDDAAADVWALAAVCHQMLAGTPPHDGPLGLLAPTAPRALVSAVEEALQVDPSARPDAAGFATLLRQSHGAAPVRLAEPVAAGSDAAPDDGEPAASPRSRRRPSRPVLLGTGAALLVVLAATVGWVSGRGTPAAPATLTSPAPSPDWAAVLDRLDAARAGAFAAADPALLRDVYAPGAQAMAADAAAIGRLRSSAWTARGVRHTMHSVVAASYDGRSVRLRVVDVLAGYELLGRDASVLARAAPRTESSYAIELVLTSAGWRIRDVRPS